VNTLRRYVFRLAFSPFCFNFVSVLRGETISTGAPKTCPQCGVTPALKVCKSAAGYYIGAWCRCGPYSRESFYYPRKDLAEAALRSGHWAPR